MSEPSPRATAVGSCLCSPATRVRPPSTCAEPVRHKPPLRLLTAQRSPQATSSKLVLLMMNRRTFNATIGDAISKKRSKWKPLLSTVPFLGREMSDYEHGLLADAAMPREFADGATITKPGAQLLFYIVTEGQVECTSETRVFSKGDFFGQAEILQDKEGSQPIRTTKGGRASFLTLTPAQFYQLIPLHALVKDSHEQATAGRDGGC